MRKLGFLAVLLFGIQAWAVVDVTCFDGGCLEEGYDVVNKRTGQCGRIVCKGESCEMDGWIEYDHWNRPVTEVECKRGGCFRVGFNGYQYRERFKGAELFDATCFGDINADELDCLKYGWEIDTLRWTQEIECRHSNCRRNGWILHDYANHRHRQSIVKCKDRGCFTDGWLHY